MRRIPYFRTRPTSCLPYTSLGGDSCAHNHNGIRAALKRNCTRARHRSRHTVTERISLPGFTTLSDKLVTGRRAHETALERAGHTVSGALSSGIPDPSPGGNLPRAALQRDTALVHPSECYPTNAILRSCTLDGLTLVSMTYSVGTARVNYRYTASCGPKARYCTRAPIGIRPVRPETAILHSCTLDVLSRASMTYSAT